MPSIHYQKIVDLSHSLHSKIPLWPGDPSLELETIANLEPEGYYLRRFSMGEHSGTHLNSPRSFYPNGLGLENYAPESFVLPAIVINICEKVAENNDYFLTLQDIENWEKQFGQVPSHCLVILYTGWQERWKHPPDFFNFDSQGKMHFPGFGLDAVQFLIEKRKIAGIGIDTHGVDPGLDESFAINQLILSRPRIVLENLTNLDQLPSVGSTVIIGTLKLEKGSGSPVSVLAFIP